MSKPPVMFHWGVSSYHGWGVFGLNLMLNWARRADFSVCCTFPIDSAKLELNPLERLIVEAVLKASHDACLRLKGLSGEARVSCMLLKGLGNNLSSSDANSNHLQLSGTPSIGVIFFESSVFDTTLRERASRYPLIIAGSTWNRDVLVGLGVHHVEVVIQGVDTTHFHPAPKTGLFADRFLVFSGGKLERRKGQDLVVQAFRAFARRHREALLVTAWSSPWPELARSLNANPALQPLRLRHDGRVDALAWTNANGIPARQVLHLGMVPNAQMPRILREVDVALFPNRAEGGTNLVAMECMACGIPTVLSANTGHRDLIRGDNCFPLERQGNIPDPRCQGWGESDVDEIVEALETVYGNRTQAQMRGRRGAEIMAGLTWGRQLDKLAEFIRPYLR